MKLIIAEKPSLGRNIAAAIGQMDKRNGYLEGNGYLVTWAFGHLFSLCDIEEYEGYGGYDRWVLDNLPCFPGRFRYALKKDPKTKKVDPGVQRQFELIRSLCNRADVDTVINAGDADREGEIIVRLCVANAGSEKPFYRLWLPDQTAETVTKALAELKEEKEYDSLASEGFARTYIDWLYGVNLTRLATLKTGKLLRVGRVIIPIVKAIYDRDLAIRNFVPEKYFTAVSKEQTDGQTVELVSKKKFEGEGKEIKAQETCDLYNREKAVVREVKNKRDTLFPGKLYSLSTLQNALSKKYKMSMNDSLAIVQGLYEKGYLTYPRTNSEYMATAEKDKVRAILSNVAKIGYPVKFRESKSIFDDSKIESHSALTPTYKIPKKTDLSEREMQVYSTVFRRFVAVFCSEPCIVAKSEITVDVGDKESFTLKGTVILEKGWTKYDDYTQKDKILPTLKEGQEVNIRFVPTEKETTPPKHYTVETLNSYLKNPFKEEKKALKEEEGNPETADDTEEYRAILEGLELGTEATRTGIIENARNSHYIELKKDVYTILPGGEFLIESLSKMGIVMDKTKTSELGQALKRVFHGKMTVEGSVGMAEKEIREIFDAVKGSAEAIPAGTEVGPCPLCGHPVVYKGRFYGCTEYQNGCKFTLNTSICSQYLSPETVRSLLETGKTPLLTEFRSKAGKPFSAFLEWQDGKLAFRFNDEKKKEPPAPNGETQTPDA